MDSDIGNSILPLSEAIERIKELKNEYYFRRECETINLEDSVGRELAETIIADTMSPRFDIAAMDGFAISSEGEYPLKISGTVYAGDQITDINKGEAKKIATGALMPEGVDAVLKIEDARVEKKLLYGIPLKKWSNVFRAGSDYKAGDKIFEKNHRILPQSAALLYSLGIEDVPVYKIMKELECEPTFIGTVPDDYDETKKLLLRACEKYDAVFTTGGVSVGERDYVADIIAETGKLIFH